MGHLARLVEESGIATVIIAAKAFRKRLEALIPPRVLITRHVMGRPLGPPGDQRRQRQVLNAALQLLGEATEAGTFVELPQLYDASSDQEIRGSNS